MKPDEGLPGNRRIWARIAGKTLFGLSFAACIFLLMELAFRVLLPAPPWKSYYSDLAGPTSLFIPRTGLERHPWRETNPAYLCFFHGTGFRTDSSGPRRVFVVGGSTTYGWGTRRPANDSFSAALGRRFRDMAEGKSVKFINAGGNGWGSTRVSNLVRELLSYDPSCIIVYSGNNEFAEHAAISRFSGSRLVRMAGYLGRFSRTFGWMESSFERFLWKLRYDEPAEENEGIGEEESGQVIRLFGHNIRAIMADCRKAGVPAIFCTVARNMRADPERLDSIHDLGFRPRSIKGAALAEWEREFRVAMGAVYEGDWKTALRHFKAAASIDGRHAKLHYWLGRSLERLGRNVEAAAEYDRYIDQARRIATGAINREIVSACREYGFTCIDVDAAFRAASRDGITRHDLFMDCMHPNKRGHELIAGLLYPPVSRIIAGSVR